MMFHLPFIIIDLLLDCTVQFSCRVVLPAGSPTFSDMLLVTILPKMACRNLDGRNKCLVTGRYILQVAETTCLHKLKSNKPHYKG